jgi:large subunit ribosomal protein L31
MAKKELHPTYFKNAKITCACGTSFVSGATQEEMRVDICSNCHPFFTGEQKLLDTAGRVEKFKTRMAKVAEPKTKKTRTSKAKK